MRRLILPLAVPPLLAACAVGVPDAPPASGVRPEAMFGGTACGRGVLTNADGSEPRPFTVVSRGQAAGDRLVLDQDIRFDDGERRARRWVIVPDGPRAYAGSLTEASGPIRARVGGDTLGLSYPIGGVPLARMTQSLTLRPDGTVINEGTARVLGVPVRRLREVIEPGTAPRDCGA